MDEGYEKFVKSSSVHSGSLSINYSRGEHGENIRVCDSKTGEDLDFSSQQEFRDWASQDPSRARYLRMFDGSVMRMDDAKELLKKMKKGKKFFLDSDYKIREWSSGEFDSEFTPALILREGESLRHEEGEGSIKNDLGQMGLVDKSDRNDGNVLRALAQVLRDLQCSELNESEIRKMADVYTLDEAGIRKLFGMLDGNPEIRKKRKGFLGILGERVYYK